MQREEILALVQQKTTRILGTEQSLILPLEKPLTEVGIDSLALVEIIAICMREMKTKVPRHQFGTAKTLQDIIEILYVHQNPQTTTNKNAPPAGSNSSADSTPG